MRAVLHALTTRLGSYLIAVVLVAAVIAATQSHEVRRSGFGEPLQLDKFAAEIRAFYDEIVVQNRPRYGDWRQWPKLWIDFWNALFTCHYTLGHLVGIGLPLYALANLVRRLSLAVGKRLLRANG